MHRIGASSLGQLSFREQKAFPDGVQIICVCKSFCGSASSFQSTFRCNENAKFRGSTLQVLKTHVRVRKLRLPEVFGRNNHVEKKWACAAEPSLDLLLRRSSLACDPFPSPQCTSSLMTVGTARMTNDTRRRLNQSYT